MKKNILLSVIIPSYNEIKNLKRNVLNEVVDYLDKQSYEYELILSDDGSTDGTYEKLVKFAQDKQQVKVIKNLHAGKGPTVQSGILIAQGKYHLFTDFDQSTPIQNVDKLLNKIQKYDVVIASREAKGAQRSKEPFYRHLMGRIFNFLVQLLILPGLKDTQCGFKMFTQKASKIIFQSLVIYGRKNKLNQAFLGAFDVEVLYIAKKNNLTIKEVPIKWKHHKTDRLNPLNDSIKMFIDIIKIRLADLQNKYN